MSDDDEWDDDDPEFDDDDDPIFDDDDECPECEGTGESWDGLCECHICGGTGVIE
jgi:hypothetical protein